MRSLCWWKFGLFGATVLSLATLIKVVRAVLRGATGEAEWGEAAGFAAAIFGMGFLCGVVVWAGRGLYQRLGMAGDAIVGLTVMVVFFISCMLLFDPELLTEKLSGGLLMLGFGAVLGLFAGAWIGHDVRKQWAEEISKREDRGRDSEGSNQSH
jgi:hypothetical protein